MHFYTQHFYKAFIIPGWDLIQNNNVRYQNDSKEKQYSK